MIATPPPSPVPEVRAPARRRMQIIPFLITLATVALAAVLGSAAWGVYMGAPWTRDATVRAYVVTMAPEVAGRIVELPVVDNKYVRKGDLLMVIDPTNYTIAVSQAEAAVQQAQASVQNIDAQMTVQQAQINANQAQLDLAQAALVFAQQQATRYQALAKDGSGTVQDAQQFTSQLHQQEAAVETALENLKLAQRQIESLKAQRMSAEASLAQAKAQLRQAQVNLERTRIRLPGRRLRDEPARAARRLRQCRRKRHLGCRRQFLLGRRVFRGNEPRSDPRRRSGTNQADGPQSDRARSRRQHRPRDQRCERAAQQSGGR